MDSEGIVFEMGMICDRCGRRFGDHCGFDCPTPNLSKFKLKTERRKMSKKDAVLKCMAWTKAIAEVLMPVLLCVLIALLIIKIK